MASFIKDPDATLDYRINWSLWLAGDTISSSEWILPAGLSLVAQTFENTYTTAWISSGELGEKYSVVNRITTASGRIEDRSIVIRIRNR